MPSLDSFRTGKSIHLIENKRQLNYRIYFVVQMCSRSILFIFKNRLFCLVLNAEWLALLLFLNTEMELSLTAAISTMNGCSSLTNFILLPNKIVPGVLLLK